MGDLQTISRVAAKQAIQTLAHKSLQTKPSMVHVEGIGKVWAEPFDGDDTFPPAIKSYEFKDGWLVYHGKNGSVGVIVGKKKDLEQWISDVEKGVKEHPQKSVRPWEPSDGGSDNLQKATKAAKKVLRSIRLEFLTREGGSVEGVHGTVPTVVNAHLDATVEVGGVRMHAGSKTAAHEAAHEAFARRSTEGRAALEALKSWGGTVSLYHAIAGDFEGLMDAAAWWALAPAKMKRTAPELHDAVTAWLK